ncbi:unnamed protein product [Pleuronectes platessa]|uniref:Uncharacterized protein n=1 Tax=Pleuronectes platessa TaxID=8262 RepID=A0A9N7YRX0_PLEPL|nr:unnamed protein product [Pleuronectes platessa]
MAGAAYTVLLSLFSRCGFLCREGVTSDGCVVRLQVFGYDGALPYFPSLSPPLGVVASLLSSTGWLLWCRPSDPCYLLGSFSPVLLSFSLSSFVDSWHTPLVFIPSSPPPRVVSLLSRSTVTL